MTDSPVTFRTRIMQPSSIVAIVAAAILAVGAVVGPDRVWGNALVAAYFVTTIGLGGAVFLALTGVVGARWHLGMREVPRRMTALFPVGGVFLLAVLACQLPRYGWHHHGEGDAGTFWFKELWLSTPFFAARSVAILLIWLVFVKWIAMRSRAVSAGRVSALFLVVFAATLSVASWDWFMALEPLWFSTIWGVYHFSGLMTATLAVIALCGVASRERRAADGIEFTDDHLHDVGQLLFGFCCFWMYIWYSQYMLIWYTNIPEESAYFARRMTGLWGPLMAANVLLNFVLPFLVLLPKPNKRSASVMTKIAVIVLLGRWLDLSLMVLPVTAEFTQDFGIWELAAVVAAAGVTVAVLRTPLAYADTAGVPFVADSN